MKLSYSSRGARRGALLGLLLLAGWMAWASWFIQHHESADHRLPLSKLTANVGNNHQHMVALPGVHHKEHP